MPTLTESDVPIINRLRFIAVGVAAIAASIVWRLL